MEHWWHQKIRKTPAQDGKRSPAVSGMDSAVRFVAGLQAGSGGCWLVGQRGWNEGRKGGRGGGGGGGGGDLVPRVLPRYYVVSGASLGVGSTSEVNSRGKRKGR